VILNSCSIIIDELNYSEIIAEYLENEKEISIHIGGNPEAVIKIHSYLGDNGLFTKMHLIGSDEKNEKHYYELRNLNELQFNLNPLKLSLGFKK
jgi:hypothetical protein